MILSPTTYAQVARAQFEIVHNHVQHIERLSRALCRVECHVVQRDSYDGSVTKADDAGDGVVTMTTMTMMIESVTKGARCQC